MSSLRGNRLRKQIKEEKVEEILDQQKEEKEEKVEVIDIVEDFSKKDKIIENLKKLNSKLLVDLDLKTKEGVSYITQKRMLTKEVDKLTIENKELSNKLKELQSIKDNYEENINNIKKEYENKENDNKKIYEEEKNKKDELISEIKKEKDTIKNDLDNLTNEYNKIKTSYKSYKKESIERENNLKEENKKLLDENKQIILKDNEIKEMREIIEENKEKILRLANENKKNQEENEKLNEENNKNIKKLEELSKNNKESLNKLEKNTKTLNNLIRENKDLKNDNKNMMSFFDNKINEVKVFEKELGKNMKGLLEVYNRDRFVNKDFMIKCINNSKDYYDILFKDYEIIELEEYNLEITKYLTLVKYLEIFINSDKKYFVFLDKDVLDKKLFIQKLREMTLRTFNLLLLDSENYDFISKDKNFIKIKNTDINSFIINKIYGKKMLKVLTDSINLYINEEKNEIVNNLNKKIINDNNVYLFYPQMLIQEDNLKIVIKDDIEINEELINYNYNRVKKTPLDINYEDENYVYIKEKDFDIELVKYYQETEYDFILLINEKIKYNPNNVIRLFNKYKETENDILVDKKTNNMLINIRNIDTENIDKVELIDFNL